MKQKQMKKSTPPSIALEITPQTLDMLKGCLYWLSEYGNMVAEDEKLMDPVDRVQNTDFSTVFKGWTSQIPAETDREKILKQVLISYVVAASSVVDDYMHAKQRKKVY